MSFEAPEWFFLLAVFLFAGWFWPRLRLARPLRILLLLLLVWFFLPLLLLLFMTGIFRLHRELSHPRWPVSNLTRSPPDILTHTEPS